MNSKGSLLPEWKDGHCREELLRWIEADSEQGVGLPEAAKRHAVRCDRCSDLMPFFEEFPASAPAVAPPPSWTEALLDRTARDRCESALERLLGYEGTDDERMTAQSHLDHCGDCARVFRAAERLSVDLPRTAAVDPGDAFTRRVLLSTSLHTPSRSRSSRLIQALGRLGEWRRRPRFAMEFAYVGAAILWLVLGGSHVDPGPTLGWVAKTPALAFGEVGRTAGAITSAAVDGAGRQVGDLAGRSQGLGLALDSIERRYRETEPSRKRVAETGGELLDALGQADLSRGSSLVGELSTQLSRLPRQFLQAPQAEQRLTNDNDESAPSELKQEIR